MCSDVQAVCHVTGEITVDKVDPEVLDPRAAWDDKDAYDSAATKLRDLFRANFDKQNFGDLGIDAVM